MKLNRITTTIAIAIAGIASLSAQNLQSVSRHGNMHDDLLASQSTINDQIRLKETQDYLDIILNEESEPELDIYKEGWESDRVNPYKNAVVPDTKVINVKDFAIPTPGYITSPYGYRPRFRRMHKGVDLKIQIGDTIRSAFDGKVRLTKYERRGYGYYVIVRHENGLETVYGHLSRFLVKPNQYVKAGEPIALGGNTGRSTGPHLHFETRFMGYAINPTAIFDFDNQTTHTDTYTFDKSTFEQGRNYSPYKGRERYYAQQKKRKTTASKSNAATHKVRKGDSLYKISQRYGVSINKLCRLNGINRNTKLQLGMVLKVK